VLAAAALVALASCPSGGDRVRLSKDEYERKVQTLYAGVQSAFRATAGSSGEKLAGRIGLAQKALRNAADELGAVKAPQEVEAENRALAAAMLEYAEALDAAVRAASGGDEQAMARFRDASAHPAVREMAEAAERMKEKGYDLGPIAKD